MDMRNKIVRGLVGILTAGALLNFGCNQQTPGVEVSGSKYNVSANKIVQTKSSFLDDGVIKVGVISDIEGAVDSVSNATKIFQNERVDVVLVAGDLYSDFARQARSQSNVKNGTKVLEPLVGIGVPVYIIPGNHESRKDYTQIIENFKGNKNVFDLNDRIADLQGVNIAGLGGYHDSRFTSPYGFLISDSQYERLEGRLKKGNEQSEPTLILTHGPPKSDTKIDYVPNVGNVGDSRLAEILSSNPNAINLHGHIHEGGGNIANYGSNSFAINVCCGGENAISGSRVGIVSIKDGNVSYQEVKLK
ncbi:MAG: metallophosphoesterase [Nanoarchaeota archaeon]